MIAEPGTKFRYDSGAVILTSAILKSRYGVHADRFAEERSGGYEGNIAARSVLDGLADLEVDVLGVHDRVSRTTREPDIDGPLVLDACVERLVGRERIGR